MTIMLTKVSQIKNYKTRDGSGIRELLHPNLHPVINQSLAEATVLAGQTTALHYHKTTEEIYFILEGHGEMQLDDNIMRVEAGDSILIKPGQNHCIKNIGESDLRFLCCCAPAYQHDDTYLIDE